MNFKFRNELKDLVPYVPGKPIEEVMKEYNLSDVIKLASNENPLGYSPKAKEAIITALDSLSLYPDGNSTSLREKLAQKYNIKVEQVIPSSGSDEMVDQLAKTFIDKDDEVIMADITFPRYFSTCKMMGGKPVIVPLNNFTHDLDAMTKAVSDKTKLMYICNPNNPTGTAIPTSEVISLLDNVPSNVIVVLDEAYREYVTRDDYMMNSESLIEKYPNLVILRTFSKAYGLAALRVGYTIAHEDIISNINKIRGPFNVNSLAQVAAIASLEDEAFLKESYDVNKCGKEYLYSEFDKMNIQYCQSEANHIFLDVGQDASSVFNELQKNGVIIRPMGSTYIRVSIGLRHENEKFIQELSKILEINSVYA
jgi:histidinol-phosphate aminotransferase